MRAVTVLSSAVMLALGACQPQQAALTTEDVAAIRSVTDQFQEAWLAGDHAALAALYTEDAVLMPPNGPIVEGRAGVEEFMASFPPVESATLTIEEIEGVGDLAYVRGTYAMTLGLDADEPITDTGKYLEIRRKQPDGSWLLSHDIFNSDRPLPQPE